MSAVSAFAPIHQPVQLPHDGIQNWRRAVAPAATGLSALTVERAHGVQAISGRSPALPQARIAPTPRWAGSSTLYIIVRQPRYPDGIVVSPSLLPDDQVAPPSQDRSSHASSPGLPLSMLAHAMSSPSETCRRRARDQTAAVTGTRSPAATAGSRTSQYRLQTVVFAAAAGVGAPVTASAVPSTTAMPSLITFVRYYREAPEGSL